MTRRRLGWLIGLLGLAAGTAFALGPPRLTWFNAGLRVDFSWPRGAGALLGAGALVWLGFLLGKGARALVLVLSVVTLLAAGHLLVYRLEVAEAGVAERGLFGSSAVGWADVARVDLRPAELVVTGASGQQIRIDTRGWEPRAIAPLERTIARRVREAAR